MTLLEGNTVQLATGSGDETVKVSFLTFLTCSKGTNPITKLWNCTDQGPTFVHEFECTHGAVLAVLARGDTIYAGCQDGYVKVLDLETKTLVRTIIVQEACE